MKIFTVKVRVWEIGNYLLKKDDTVTVEHIGKGLCSIDNQFFRGKIMTTYNDLKIHCKREKLKR